MSLYALSSALFFLHNVCVDKSVFLCPLPPLQNVKNCITQDTCTLWNIRIFLWKFQLHESNKTFLEENREALP